MKIENYLTSDLENEIRAKVGVLLMDSGARMGDDEMRHLIYRVPDILREKFSHLDFDDIQNAWEKGSTGQYTSSSSYGQSTKINVNNLISWIYMKVREIQEAKRFQQGQENFKYVEWTDRFATGYGEFICWLRRECEIYPQHIDELHNPFVSESVSSLLKNISVKYFEAKKENKLFQFKNELRNQYIQ